MPRCAALALGMIILLFAHSTPAHDGSACLTPGPQPTLRMAQAPAQEDPSRCRVTLRLISASTKGPLAGCVRITDTQGRALPLEGLLPRSTGIDARSFGDRAYTHLDSWYVLEDEATIELPADALNVEAFSGLGSARTVQTLDLRGIKQAARDIVLRPLPDWTNAGWYAGNAHLHLQGMTQQEAETYAGAVARADGLDLVYFSYLERAGVDQDYISNQFTPASLEAMSRRSSVFFGYGEEYRHNFPRAEGYGHVMMLDLAELILPASSGTDLMKTGNDDRPLHPGIDAARAQGATLLWCHHTRGHEDIPNWLAGRIDAQLVFDQGSEGRYEDGVYPYLNVGLQAPLATGTDWFFRGMAMTYVRVEGDLTGPRWLEALRQGRTFITNGPLLSLQINGASPGAVLNLKAGDFLTVTAQAVARNDFGSIELVRNGKVVASAPATATVDGFATALDLTIPHDAPAWYALRIPWYEGTYDRPGGEARYFNEYGKPLFAHTSPIYAPYEGKGVFDPDAAAYLHDRLVESEKTIQDAGVFSAPEKRDAVLAIYRDARQRLQARSTSPDQPWGRRHPRGQSRSE